MDDLLEGLLTEETTTTPASISSANALAQEVAEQRERLAIIAAGGRARQYLGKAWSVKEIGELGDDEVGKLYSFYEARLGASITKTLGRAALQLYADVVSMFLPIPLENIRPLVDELESDPFVDHALSNTACGFILPLRGASCADHRGGDHDEVLPIWTPVSKAYRRRWTRETTL